MSMADALVVVEVDHHNFDFDGMQQAPKPGVAAQSNGPLHSTP